LIFIITIFIHLLIAQEAVYFDGSRAKDLLDYQCDFGPRYPGSRGHDDFADSLKTFLDNLVEMNLVYKDSIYSSVGDKIVEITNFHARFNPRASERILFLAHWDTREFADKDKNIESRSMPVIGANDGASGTAILMTLAEMLSNNPPINIGVDLLFLDGEDMGTYGDSETWALGAKSFSKNIKKPFPKYAICLDMVGDRDQEFLIEGFSYRYAPEIVRKVWELANNLGYNQFKYSLGQQIIDDHYVLFQNTGIPSIDIIDFQYPNASDNYWHTIHDTPDKCSSESLEAVGTVIATLIYHEDK
jgi:glutaminyl-peptide cyclotransferase